MTNDNEDNDIELIGLNEFTQDDENDIELGDEDERPFPDSDEAIRALQDVAESVDELLDEAQRLRDEIKLLRAERVEAERTILRLESQYGVAIKDRDAARREVCDWYHTDESGCVKSGSEETAIKRGWDCFTTNDSNA
jgi:hypothetical protein